METFLSEVTNQILSQHPNNLEQVMIVFNNRRSGLFLKKEFIKRNKTSFLPKIIGIDDLVTELGNLKIISNEFLLFELYDIHCKFNNKNKKFNSFEEFISFGNIMISDFSEIDLYCVNAQKLFNNLHELKQLGEWNIKDNKLSQFQQDYLNFYQSLYQYYSELHTRLYKLGMAYKGMAYREVAENINTLLSNIEYSHTYFIGFNALSKCEEFIIKAFLTQHNGKIITDGDPFYYRNNEKHEAGYFLRKHKDIFKQKYAEHFDKEKKINIISCPENILQTKYAGQILSNQSQEKIEKTAIILSDESLLLPMLNSLPIEIASANISMGFPFINTEVHTLMINLFSLYNKVLNQKFYHQDILNILSNYQISNILGIKNAWASISKYLSQNAIIYLDFKNLNELAQSLNIELTDITFLFLNPNPTPNDFLKIATQLTIQLYNYYTKTNNNNNLSTTKQENYQEIEALGNLYETLKYFINLQTKYNFITNLNTLKNIYIKFAQQRTISFYGEALSGLQILGVLESRNLDFDKIILLSVNEGLLPSKKGDNTLIPLQLKQQFGIPTYKEKEAIYAYHFYRFLQRAKNIYLIYHTESDDSSSKGEPSRYIMQIQDTLTQQYPNINISKKVVYVNNTTPITQSQPIGQKNDAIMMQLNKLASIGFSPSALIDYNTCPLLFYYKRILNIKEPDDINEEISVSKLGTYIHGILQEIYSQNLNGIIKQDTLRYYQKNIDNLINSKIQESTQNGPNYLIKSIAKEQINNLLEKEIKILNHKTIKIVELEKSLSTKLSIPSIESPIIIKGYADRIDYLDDIFRIIDYKTGHVDATQLHGDINHKFSDKLFQVMTYLWIYFHDKKEIPENIQSGIYPLQNLNDEFIPIEWNQHTLITINDLKEFESILTKIFKNIMDPYIDFLPTKENAESCSYCPMNNICQNQKK